MHEVGAVSRVIGLLVAIGGPCKPAWSLAAAWAHRAAWPAPLPRPHPPQKCSGRHRGLRYPPRQARTELVGLAWLAVPCEASLQAPETGTGVPRLDSLANLATRARALKLPAPACKRGTYMVTHSAAPPLPPPPPPSMVYGPGCPPSCGMECGFPLPSVGWLWGFWGFGSSLSF